ncbi:MAG TPA: NADH-quinone oxidoreductase subunit C [Burkholderiales bacterium]|nr:NADH-quinone oxidoreductase subunit C [Burkholderiales bacterium]
MNVASDALSARLEATLGDKVAELITHVGELTLIVKATDWIDVAHVLRDVLGFEQMIDLCGVDYQDYGDGGWEGNRFAVVMQLLSISHNIRLRVRTFAQDDDFPVIPSVVEVWPSANWYEREAFDLFGILFDGHPDLRRILTDYGFVGHPFRKDFPLSGNVEMRYDPEQGRVIYQPVTIEERVLVPRVIREETYRG